MKTGTCSARLSSGGNLNCLPPEGCGTIFKLAPPASQGATWTFSLVHTFSGGPDGANPGAGVILHRGNLMGTTVGGGSNAVCDTNSHLGCGTVFKFQP